METRDLIFMYRVTKATYFLLNRCRVVKLVNFKVLCSTANTVKLLNLMEKVYQVVGVSPKLRPKC